MNSDALYPLRALSEVPGRSGELRRSRPQPHLSPEDSRQVSVTPRSFVICLTRRKTRRRGLASHITLVVPAGPSDRILSGEVTEITEPAHLVVPLETGCLPGRNACAALAFLLCPGHALH